MTAPQPIARPANLDRPPPRPQTDREFLAWLASPEPAREAAALARAVHEQEPR
jgi:hypothetical protein